MSKYLPKKVRFVFAWYDFWVGAYWDRRHCTLYILPLPFIGLALQFREEEVDLYKVSDGEIFRTIKYLDNWGESGAANVVKRLACDRDFWKDEFLRASGTCLPEAKPEACYGGILKTSTIYADDVEIRVSKHGN